MTAADDRPVLRNLGTLVGAPDGGFRYMRRRRVGTANRAGDPLDGLVNLFTIALVLAVGLFVAALTALGMTGLLTDENMTIVTNPGTPDMQVIVKDGGKITKVDMSSGMEVAGYGTLLGSFYQLADGAIIWVPAGQTPPGGATPVPGSSPTPWPSASPTPYPTPTPPSVTPTPSLTPPTPSVTLTPESGSTPR